MAISRSQLQETFKIYTNENITTFKSKKNSLRIMQFNVHIWKDYLNVDSMDKIFDLIKISNSDIVGINEGLFFSNSTKNKIKEYIKDLGYDYFIECNGKYGINLILSKFPIIFKKIISLGKDPIHLENRYAVNVTINISTNKNINILLTHLDVWDESEETRLNQIKLILNQIDSTYLLIGDFNSLRKSDYSGQEWNNLKEDSLLRNVEIQNKVTKFVESNNFVDCFVKINKNPPKVSVWSMRRVDYIYVGTAFPYNIIDCDVYPTLVSDHYPIYVDIKI